MKMHYHSTDHFKKMFRYETIQDEKVERSPAQKAGLWSFKEKQDAHLVYKGIIFAVISGGMFAVTSSITKYLHILDPFELALVRFSGCVLLALVHIAYNDDDMFPSMENSVKMFLLARGLIVTPAISSAFAAIHLLPISEATVLIFTSPVLTAIFARIFLKEPFHLPHWLSMFFTILGVIFLTKLPQQIREITDRTSTITQLSGCGLAILASVLMSAMYILARKTKSVHEAVAVLHYSWIATLVAAITLWIRGSYSWPQCGAETCLLLLMIITSFYGQFYMTRALRLSMAGPVALVRAATDIAVTYAFQVVIFKEIPDASAVIGSLCICMAMILVTKWVPTSEQSRS